MAQSILVAGPADTDPPQGLAETPLGPGDNSDSPSDSRADGTLDEDRAQTVRGDGLLEPGDGVGLADNDEADPVGRPTTPSDEPAPDAFDDA